MISSTYATGSNTTRIFTGIRLPIRATFYDLASTRKSLVLLATRKSLVLLATRKSLVLLATRKSEIHLF
jgi:hypothetical protein